MLIKGTLQEASCPNCYAPIIVTIEILPENNPLDYNIKEIFFVCEGGCYLEWEDIYMENTNLVINFPGPILLPEDWETNAQVEELGITEISGLKSSPRECHFSGSTPAIHR